MVRSGNEIALGWEARDVRAFRATSCSIMALGSGGRIPRLAGNALCKAVSKIEPDMKGNHSR